MIDATSPVTKYYQLKDILVKNIQDGKWPPQSRMSSENELCEAYNVSRVTVRKAIDLLVQEGLSTPSREKAPMSRESISNSL